MEMIVRQGFLPQNSSHGTSDVQQLHAASRTFRMAGARLEFHAGGLVRALRTTAAVKPCTLPSFVNIYIGKTVSFSK
jgi:hypothetical protein